MKHHFVVDKYDCALSFNQIYCWSLMNNKFWHINFSRIILFLNLLKHYAKSTKSGYKLKEIWGRTNKGIGCDAAHIHGTHLITSLNQVAWFLCYFKDGLISVTNDVRILIQTQMTQGPSLPKLEAGHKSYWRKFLNNKGIEGGVVSGCEQLLIPHSSNEHHCGRELPESILDGKILAIQAPSSHF